MGAVGGLLGLNGGAGGTGFQGPSGANITNPVTGEQLSNAYTGAQGAMTGQQDLLAALQRQNGLGNQSQVYGQLQGIANGTGPNPAQAMLNQATGQNVANQAALMAGQRGAGSNVGLMARQAGMQGAGIQQNAAGQAATMQANQSLNAINQAGQMANAQAGNQIGQTNANTQAQQAEQQALLGAHGNYNSAQAGSQASVNAGNAALANTSMQGQQGMIGGLLNGAGVGIKTLFGADGGVVHMANGGDSSAFQGAASKFGQFLQGAGSTMAPQAQESVQPTTPSGQLQKGSSQFAQNLVGALGSRSSAPNAGAIAGGGGSSGIANTMMPFSRGGQVPAMVSPGEKYLSPQAVQQVEKGANPMQVGETIPGKPSVGGAKNSYANDTVSKTLEEGGVVVPRSATQSKNPHRASSEFVHKVLAKRMARG